MLLITARWVIQSGSAITREQGLLWRALKNQKTPIAPRFIVMSNRRLYRVMPGSGLCSLFILWFHLSVGEGKQHEKQSSGTDAALCLKCGCLQTFTIQFSNIEKCLCVCIYIFIIFTQTTFSCTMYYNPSCELDVLPSSSKLHTSGLPICEMNMPVLIFKLMPRTVLRGLCVHLCMQYAGWELPRKYNIIKGKLTSVISLLAKTLSLLVFLTFQFFIYFQFFISVLYSFSNQ